MKRTLIALIAAAALSIPAAALAENMQNDPGNPKGPGERGQTMQERGSHGDRTAKNRGSHERGADNGNFERRRHHWWIAPRATGIIEITGGWETIRGKLPPVRARSTTAV